MDKKQNSAIYPILEIHISFKDTYRWKVKRQKKIFHGNGNQKRVRMAILI